MKVVAGLGWGQSKEVEGIGRDTRGVAGTCPHAKLYMGLSLRGVRDACEAWFDGRIGRVNV